MDKVIEYIDFEIARLQAVRRGVVKSAEEKMRGKGAVAVKKNARVHAKRMVRKTGIGNKSQVRVSITPDA